MPEGGAFCLKIFLSTPSARRATDLRKQQDPASGISIHALREEGDLLSAPAKRRNNVFLSTPSARRATLISHGLMMHWIFLSTPSARRATPDNVSSSAAGTDFYPRPPRGGRLHQKVQWCCWTQFLSTPSARRATTLDNICAIIRVYFYPRPPRGGRLIGGQSFFVHEFISIHALREEGDVRR